MTQQRAHRLVFAILLFCHLPICLSAETPGEELKVVIDRNVPVPMRDGTILRADVYRPDRGGPYPVLVHRTPYGKHSVTLFDQFARAGYIVVSQDVRGRYESEGNWEWFWQRKAYDAQDGYDTVEWAAKLVGSNGKVGTFETFEPDGRQWSLASLNPPSLVAMSARGSFIHITQVAQGTLPLPWLKLFVRWLSPETRRRNSHPGVHTFWEAAKLWDESESEKWIHWLPWVELPQEIFEDETEAIKHWFMTPHHDLLQLDNYAKDITVPNLFIYGWYYFMLDDIPLFQNMVRDAKTNAARRGSRLIIGPWPHGFTGRSIGNIDFGKDAVIDKVILQIRWFDYWLKGIQNGIDKDAPVRIFVMGDNKWRDEQAWPPQEIKERIFYLSSDGGANTPGGNGRLTDKIPHLPS